MTASWKSWKLSTVICLVVGGANVASSGESALAQITPDTTLGNENSTVTSIGEVDSINGGATRGANLFHSFGEFNINEGRAAVFTNPPGIENILTRVTGANPSNILGTLGVAGNANLFLINPNGIIFGQNARLDIGGSFVGTTANAIAFGDQGFFSASNPENSSPLLTVNPSALLFNQIRAASIENNSVADSGLNPSAKFTATGLRVLDGNSLLLVGGDINMNGGGLNAFGGRVELGSLAGAGTVGLNGNGNNLSLSFPDSVERSNISLSNGAGADVTAGDGGSIAVNAQNLEMTDESVLFAGIDSGLGSDNSKAGNIELNATGAINLNNGSLINNRVRAKANGQGGNISISASTLQVEGGAQVSVSTTGDGKGGSLMINASDVQIIGRSADDQFGTALGAFAASNSNGDAGSLTIKTNTLLVKDGAQVSASTRGAGKGGSLTVDAYDVQIIGTSSDGRVSSGLGVSAQPESTGDAGDLTIKTNTLLVKDGAQVRAGTFARGKGGSLTVDASDVQVLGESADGQIGSVLTASADADSTGDAGDLTIKTNTLLVKDGAQVGAATFSGGKGGSLTIDASNVQLIGTSADGRFPSGLGASALRNSTGNAGNLTIKTHTLLDKDGAQVGADTYGAGEGGALTVDASEVQLIGTSADGQTASGLGASAQRNSTGNAGNLTIKTNTLLVQDGAVVGADTYGAGKGGSLTVDASDVQLIGTSADGQISSALAASAARNSTGDAGDLTIKTNTLLVQDEAGVTVQSLGTGTAGNLTIDARSISLNNNALLSANTRSATVDPNIEQVTININSQNLIMRRGSNIRTDATGNNVIGGNININSDIIAALENSDISANSANFRGGNVRINAQGIFGTQFRDMASDRTSDITATGASPEFSGNVDLNIPDADLNSGLVNLLTVPVDTEVVQACTPDSDQAQSEFVVTGRGGLPPTPIEALNTDAIAVDWVTLQPESDNKYNTVNSTSPTTLESKPIVEATGWIINRNGQVVLTASAPTATPHSSWQTLANCSS